jgi:glycerol-3-phosphate dehydrogenase (NAD(P)+)
MPTPNNNPTARPVLVLGAGSWGCALAQHLCAKGLETRLWEVDSAEARRLSRERTVPGKLEDFSLDEKVQVGSVLAELLEGAGAAVFVVPSKYVRATASAVARALEGAAPPPLLISCAKGLEKDSLAPMSRIVGEELGVEDTVALSGPSHAEEVAAGLPTTVVAASRDLGKAEETQALFNSDRFRVYTSEDIVGVELGGALKNVIAIACGAAAGLGFGDNTMAALVTRGLAEISRLGVAMGADPLTFAGLSGIGDLIVTCASRHSRNRRLGLALAAGKTLEQGLKEIGMVVEGVETAGTISALKEKYRVDMPIATQVARCLFEGVPVAEAVVSLMMRDPKPEWEFDREPGV